MANNMKKCAKCKFKKIPQHVYPCSRCVLIGYVPLTCSECRWDCNKKGLTPCEKFEWD